MKEHQARIPNLLTIAPQQDPCLLHFSLMSMASEKAVILVTVISFPLKEQSRDSCPIRINVVKSNLPRGQGNIRRLYSYANNGSGPQA